MGRGVCTGGRPYARELNYTQAGRMNVEMSAREPTARYCHAAVSVGDKLFVWGGYNHRKTIHTTSLESFNVSALKWEQPQQLNGSLPGGLRNAAVNSNSECAYTYGGYTDSIRLNILYEINPRTLWCRELLPNNPSHAPQKTSGCRMVDFNNKLVVYGGYTDEGYTDDLLVFDLNRSE